MPLTRPVQNAIKTKGVCPLGEGLIDRSGTLLDNPGRFCDINGIHNDSNRLPITHGYGISHFCTVFVVVDCNCHHSLTGFSLFPGSYAPGKYLAPNVVDLNPEVLNL